MTELTTVINEIAQKVTISDLELIAKLNSAKGWDGKYREIMLLGKQLPLFQADLKSDEALVSGCESQVWLHSNWHEQQLWLAASSDSKIVRGLLVIVLAKFNGKTKEQIASVNIEGYFSELGLSQHLSPSRTNGLNAIVEKIKEISRLLKD